MVHVHPIASIIQQILEEEVTELLGRDKSERKVAVDAAPDGVPLTVEGGGSGESPC